MKNKQEKAQMLSEALEQVDESLLQQAMEVETAAQFHALNGKMPKIRHARERTPFTPHRAAAIAACMAIALTIAFGGMS